MSVCLGTIFICISYRTFISVVVVAPYSYSLHSVAVFLLSKMRSLRFCGSVILSADQQQVCCGAAASTVAAAALHKRIRIGELKAAAAHWVVPSRCLSGLTSMNVCLYTIYTLKNVHTYVHTYISTYASGKKLVGAR